MAKKAIVKKSAKKAVKKTIKHKLTLSENDKKILDKVLKGKNHIVMVFNEDGEHITSKINANGLQLLAAAESLKSRVFGEIPAELSKILGDILK